MNPGAFFKKLIHQMSDLKALIIVLHRQIRHPGIAVSQSIALIFLEVEALVFNLPAQTSCLRAAQDVFIVERQGRQPDKTGGFLSRHGFYTLKKVECSSHQVKQLSLAWILIIIYLSQLLLDAFLEL